MDQDGAFGTFRERVPALRVRNVPDTWGTQLGGGVEWRAAEKRPSRLGEFELS